MVVFTIKGQPMGKQRPKFSTFGGYIKTYTPKETVNYETLVKLSYQQQCKEYFGESQIYMFIKAYYQIPKSYSKKKANECLSGNLRPTTKPDCDNIAKIIADSLNGVSFADDKQIVDMRIEKYYAIEPKVVVEIGELKC